MLIKAIFVALMLISFFGMWVWFWRMAKDVGEKE